MVEIRWTPQAADDLEAIVEFIALDSPQYARLTALKLMESIEQLRMFPESGRKVPEARAPEIREVIQGNYRIIYRYREAVEILTILHGARLLGPERLG